MAMASLLPLLIWALSVQLANTCLACWPDAAKYFSYDVQLLLRGNRDAAEKLERLFLGSRGQPAIYGGRFLERDVMEREAGNLFLLLEQIIQKNGKDSERLMTEAEQEKLNFSRKLEEVSHTFQGERTSPASLPFQGPLAVCSYSCDKIRFRPYELADCTGCRVVKASCKDPLICAGSNVAAGVLVTIVILLGAGAAVWYYRRKKKGEGESQAEEDDGTESSKSSESSQEWSAWSEEADTPSTPAAKSPNLPKTNIPPSPPYANIPNPSHSRSRPSSRVPPPIPSPPHIWSPPS